MSVAQPPPGQAGAVVIDPRLVKQVVQERSHGHYEVKGVQFTTLSADEIARYGEIEVLNEEKYDLVTRGPISYGALDSRLGSANKNVLCGTCGQKREDCIGHFGNVRLALPVFHVGFMKYIYTLLQCICKTCGRILMRPEERGRFLARLRKPTTDDMQRKALHKKVVEQCKKVRYCPFCQAYNAVLRKGSGVPLLFKHNINGSGVPSDIKSRFKESFNDQRTKNNDVEQGVDKAQEDVNPLMAYNLFRQMTPEDRELIDTAYPERLLMTSLPVAPVVLRPSVSMGDVGMSEDDLTHAIAEIVGANKKLKQSIEKGADPKNVHESWKFLQDQCAIYVNSDTNGLELPKGRPIRSLCTRLKGKDGRFRGNLSGKRVDFSGRTVISPDPNVSVEEVVVPQWIAKRMTYPERVCEANIERLRDAIRRGPEEHPGARSIRYADDRGKYLGSLKKNFRLKLADKLVCGDMVERHMKDGDVVLFNRQPSLHRLSIMAHKAKVMPGRTLRFNECVCGPYNADFDGDEMNIHLPQTEEARAEASKLMGVKQGLVTPKSGEVVIHATQDFLTASFLITQKNVFFSRDKFCQLCCYMTDGTEHIELPPPAILKPCELWTGKQVISVLLRPNRDSRVLVNLEAPEKNYTKQGESMCKNDGWVLIRNSELLSGNLGKKILGGAKNGLFFRLIRDNSADAAVSCMSRIAKLSSRWLANRGFTIGIDDVTAHDVVKAEKAKIIEEKYNVVDEKIREYNAGTLALKPGCNLEQTLEAVVNGELGRIRDLTGDMCEKKLDFMNKPRIMAQCGSKGSPVNLCQMMACVGQQNVLGQRIRDGFVKRTLPHFKKGSKEPMARGFVANSFYSGLFPPEFFFHTMGGREGLVDTAVKTADTGYMQRKLVKALEDLSLKYDLTVRTSGSEVVQFMFGDDGLNPSKMETGSKILDFDYVMNHVQQVLRPVRALDCNGRVAPTWTPVESGAPGRLQAQRFSSDVAKGKRRRVGDKEQVAQGLWIENDLEFLREKDAISLVSAVEAGRALPIPKLSGRAAVARGDTELRHPMYRKRPVLPLELSELAKIYVAYFLDWARRTSGSKELDLSQMENELRAYFRRLEETVANTREQLGFDRADTAESVANVRQQSSQQEAIEHAKLIDAGCPSQFHLEEFLNRCASKYVQAILMPGEAVGAVAAQSIGEPATQMTLKTFHFAGVASMNVTLGVPRIKEIINAAKKISTPIISCVLHDELSETTARIVKGRIESTKLGDICKYFKEVYDPQLGCFITVKLDVAAIAKLQLELTIESIKEALLDHKNLEGIRLQESDIEIMESRDKLRVKPPQKKKQMYFSVQALKHALPEAVVHGVKGTVRAVINKDDKKGPTKYNILVEGTSLLEVMTTPGIKSKSTTSNDVMKVEEVLGIEAARSTIMSEITATMGGHGIAVDARHIQLLGDCMTYRGAVLGINRYGIQKMRTSTLMLASFERTNDHIFDAAAHGRNDPVTGVSECIILGSTINLGTGLFKLLYDHGGQKPADKNSTSVGKALRAPLISTWRKQSATLNAVGGAGDLAAGTSSRQK